MAAPRSWPSARHSATMRPWRSFVRGSQLTAWHQSGAADAPRQEQRRAFLEIAPPAVRACRLDGWRQSQHRRWRDGRAS
ncbi:MAG TPA: hypothetical protein VK595_15165 [Vicinamibacterales bacterium]|nr:hypothetical protein [Vicinamibacterales bacterium]